MPANSKPKLNRRAKPNTALHFSCQKDDSPFRIGGPATEKEEEKAKEINTSYWRKIDHLGNNLLTENNHSLPVFAKGIEPGEETTKEKEAGIDFPVDTGVLFVLR